MTTIPLFLGLVLISLQVSAASIHLRAKTGGIQYKWSKLIGEGKTIDKIEMLEPEPILINTDFKSVQIKKLKSPPSHPNSFELELIFSEAGKSKYISIANKDRNREYCYLFENEVFQCMAFPPESKGLWDKSFSIYGPFNKTQADELASKINHAITINPYDFVLQNAEFAKEMGTTRFYLDLNDDKRLDLLAGERWTGNAGGTYFIFLAEGQGFRQIGEIFLNPSGFQLLNSKHNGIRDILNYHREGGFEGDLVTYHFNGQKFEQKSRKAVKSNVFGIEIKPTKVKSFDAAKNIRW